MGRLDVTLYFLPFPLQVTLQPTSPLSSEVHGNDTNEVHHIGPDDWTLPRRSFNWRHLLAGITKCSGKGLYHRP